MYGGLDAAGPFQRNISAFEPPHAQKEKILLGLHTGNEMQETQYQNTAFH